MSLNDEDFVQSLIDDKYIRVQTHSKCPYEILNYTQKTQFEKKWNEVTLACRGLIRHRETKEVVARGLPKFFNYGELKPEERDALKGKSFTVDDKMDGSCGILYWDYTGVVDGVPCIATRGSFDSPQALHATNLLQTKYKPLLSTPGTSDYALLRRDLTYVFEIIYPENRIVVDYGDIDNIFLITSFETATGREISRYSLANEGTLPFPEVKSFDGLTDMDEILKISDPHNEGFVIRFSGDEGYKGRDGDKTRVKVKFDEYKRLHRIVTQMSSIDIWTNLMEGNDFDEILERVPDEFFDWVKKVKEELEGKFAAVEAEVMSAYDKFRGEVSVGDQNDRRVVAKYFGTLNLSKNKLSALFALYDGKDYRQKIWSMLRPEFCRPSCGGYNRDED